MNRQYKIAQNKLYYLYRFIILPWEIEWRSQNFNTNIGSLKQFEKDSGILLKCCRTVSDLEAEIKEYAQKYKKIKGALLFNRTDNKPKSILRHLRNVSAHGHFKTGTINKNKCLKIEHYSETDQRLRAYGHIPFDHLKPLIRAIMTTRE